jgi:hypothetical protein
LRIYGAANLSPAGLVHEGARGPDLMLVGISDPQIQSGGRAVTNLTARISGNDVVPPPQLGFAGAAALDAQGRAFGMVTLKTPVVASAGPPPLPQAGIASVETIRRFLESRYITPTTGRPGVDAARAAVVRVICVRR